MPPPRTLPDAEVFRLVLASLEAAGDKAVSFGNLSRACGLAPATLAQRFGSVEGMLTASLTAEWDRLCAAVEEATADSEKGAQGLLKTLPAPTPAILAASLRDATLRARAAEWRERVEVALALRRGGGPKGREAAALIFAAWMSRETWEAFGGKGFRLQDLVKRLG